MIKLKLTLSILALTVSQITMADYVMKIPLEVSNGGSLPNGSIIFKTTVAAPVEPPILNCTASGISAECDERLGAWEKFAADNGLKPSWNDLIGMYYNLTNIPIEPYPTTHVDRLDLSANQLTNIDGLSNITSAGDIILSGNNLSNVNGLSGLTTATNIYLQSIQLTNLDGLSNLKTVDSILLTINKLTNVNGLSNLTSAGYIDLSNNQLTDVTGLANVEVSRLINIDSSYSGDNKLPANSRFCSLTPMERFGGASKSQVCETP